MVLTDDELTNDDYEAMNGRNQLTKVKNQY